MTNKEAVFCEVKPYCTDSEAAEIEKALLQAGCRLGVSIEASAAYAPENEKAIALAAVLVLAKYTTLTSEHEGEWQQGYNDKLEKRIAFLCRTNGLDASEFVSPTEVTTLRDGSKLF